MGFTPLTPECASRPTSLGGAKCPLTHTPLNFHNPPEQNLKSIYGLIGCISQLNLLFFSGHTSVKMCQRVMGSIDLFKASRGAYTSKAGFDEHTTTRHSVADPFADQLKGAWFCLRNGLLDPKREPEEIPCCYPLDGQGKPSGKVSKAFLDVTEKGVIKISQNFKFKLYDSFPELRYQLLTDK